MSRRITYQVDLDERGEFAATVYEEDRVLAEINTEDAQFLTEVCGLRSMRDVAGLRQYFTGIGIVDPSDTFEVVG